MSPARLAPALATASLAATALHAEAASAATCTPVRIERPADALPASWSRALSELAQAISVQGQAWSCGGGALALSIDASGRSATLTFADADGRHVQRRIPRADDLVPSAKALLAVPEPDAVAAPPPDPPVAPIEAPPPVASVNQGEPRFVVDALVGARYRRPDKAVWTAGTLRAMIPFGAWSGGFWFRGAVPVSLEGAGQRHLRTTSEVTLGLSGGRRILTEPFTLDVTVDPSLSFAFEPGFQAPFSDHREDYTIVRIHPQLGLGLRGTFPIAGPIRGAVALDGEFLPDTIGAGVSIGVEAVIR